MGVIAPGDLVSSWIVDGSRGRELVAQAEAYISSREGEIKLAQMLSHAKANADSVRAYDIMATAGTQSEPLKYIHYCVGYRASTEMSLFDSLLSYMESTSMLNSLLCGNINVKIYMDAMNFP